MSTSEEVVLFKRGDGAEPADGDIWDDTALIAEYDRLMSATYAAAGAAEPPVGPTKAVASADRPAKPSASKPTADYGSKSGRRRHWEWRVGDRCAAPYAGESAYYAAVVSGGDPTRKSVDVLYEGFEADGVESHSANELLTSGPCGKRRRLERAAELGLLRDAADDGEGEEDGDEEEGEGAACDATPAADDSSADAAPAAGVGSTPRAGADGAECAGRLVPPPPHVFAAQAVPSDNEALSAMLMSWYMAGYHTGYYTGQQQAAAKRKAKD